MAAKNKTITIVSVVNVLEGLSNDDVHGSVYLIDNNLRFGSQDEGTPVLKTKINVGDILIWTVMPLEVDSYVGLANVTVGEGICEPTEHNFPDSDVIYWLGEVKKVPKEPIEYSISYWLGTRPEAMSPKQKPFLIG